MYPFVGMIKAVVHLLVVQQYAQLERETSGVRLSASDMAQAIRDYGRVLVSPPEATYEQLDVVQIRHSIPPQWSVRMGLWTAEEGRSDLTLELTVVQRPDGYCVEVDDIHVL